MLAHRYSWVLERGPIPLGSGYHGTCVLHSCDEPLCVRPTHLFLGSQQDNIADMVNKGRSPENKLSSNPNVKLTLEQVETIRETYKTGLYTQKEIGDKFGVTNAHISRIVRLVAWTLE